MAELNETYVVHGAQVTCTMGMRPSAIILEETYGVYLRQQPQMTVGDSKNSNIICFGGCYSMENPDTQKKAQEIKEEVDRRCPDTFLDSVMNFFCGGDKGAGQQEASEESLRVLGVCTPNIAGGMEWDHGKDGVKTEGKETLLGTAKLYCMYGGEIEIVHSGQQEG